MAEMNYNEDYGSEFDEQESKKTWRNDELSGAKRKSNVTTGVPSKRLMTEEYSRIEGRNQRFHFLALDAYSRHKKMINDYLLYYGPGIEHFKRDSSGDVTDLDVLRKEHRFIWNESEESDAWEQRLAKKYYDRLFKEYCIADLSRYKENKIALRWRIEKEVLEGKGQFICGNKRCQENEGLKSWEVNFCYEEQNEKKNALVKLRLCPDCSFKLNYHHQRKLAKQQKKDDKEKEKREKRSISKKKRKHQRKDDGKNRKDKDDYSSSSEEEKTDKRTSTTSSREKSHSLEEKAGTSKEDTDVPEDIWKGPAKAQVDKTREEEFEEYFQDMFL